jgi:hypothetical protein
MKNSEGTTSNTSGHNNGSNKAGAGGEKKSVAAHDDVYGYCGKKGHWAHECRKKKRDEEAQAHLAHGEEEEESLLLAHDVVLNLPPSCYPASTPVQRHHIHIMEQKVFVDLGTSGDNYHNNWVLDTGGTNHMTGLREIFTELDSQVYGTVKMGDGVITNIEGRRSIVLVCKNGKHRTLTRVFYTPRLKASILSVGKIDESDCRVVINRGVLRVYDQAGHLLAKVVQDDSRLYFLKLNVGQPV